MNIHDLGDGIEIEGAFALDAVTVTVASGGALAAATSIPVLPLAGPIPSGTVLAFDTPATATLTAAADVGATTLTVSALAVPILAGDIATYAGGPADPTTVAFKVQPSASAVTTYLYGTDAQLVRVSTGIYRVNWLVAVAGVHEYRFIGTGAVQQEQGGQFYGRPRNVG